MRDIVQGYFHQKPTKSISLTGVRILFQNLPDLNHNSMNQLSTTVLSIFPKLVYFVQKWLISNSYRVILPQSLTVPLSVVDFHFM